MGNVCYDCRYKGTCGDSHRTEPCNGKVKFARSSPDMFGFMEYCVETFTPYESVVCKNRTTARKEVQNFKKQGKMSAIIGVTQNGNDYIIKI